MRSKKAVANVTSSLILQIVTIICGFIGPRLILETFGSNVNGIISSINQFLSYIILLESGVGGVIKAALYKPLADNNIDNLNGLIRATEKFFRVIAYIFIVYLLILAILYPYLVINEFNWIFTFTLVLIIGLSIFVQYYFSITYQIMLEADQKIYFTSGLQIITVIMNTILLVSLIKFGASIHIIKLCSALIFVIRPLVFNIYIKKNYIIIKNYEANSSALKQRWDGFSHHIAYFIHTNTDIVILTIFTNVKEVSVYSIYYMVVFSIRKIIDAISAGLNATIGNLIAKNENDLLNRTLNIYEFLNFFIITVLFTSSSILILPFISVYTRGIHDVNYYRPFFAYLLTAAEAVYCIRTPYSTVILASGHFKQTKSGAYIEAIINILLSVILVNYLGIIGVAIGTLIAMFYRTIQFVLYLSKNILNRSVWDFIKRCCTNGIAVLVTFCVIKTISFNNIYSFRNWTLYAIKITIITVIITYIINAIFYSKDIKEFQKVLKNAVLSKHEASVNKVQ